MGEPGMITVVGLDGSPLAPAAATALAGATLVVGGRRQLAAAPPPPGAAVVELGPLGPALSALAGHDGDAVVLASGDPGFFGVLRCLREQGLDPAVLPAVSSVALAFARAGLSWDDAQVASAHGRDPRQAVNLCRAHAKVAVLTAPGFGPAELAAALAGWPRRLVVAELLGTPQERITACSLAAAAGREWADPNVVLVLAGQPGDHAAAGPGWCWPAAMAPAGWALPEEEFDQRDAVMTKAEVRALALARLGPGPGRLIWDVGAGTGSVGIECARFGAAVIAVERDTRRAQRVRDNARRHGVDVRVVAGEAPATLAGLPDPDAVFVGGGGVEVVAEAAARRPARIVVALAAVERVGAASTALSGAGYAVAGTLLQAARLSPLPGGVHRLGAVNPVFVLWAEAAGSAVRIVPPIGGTIRTDHGSHP
jgi:precorrin-6B C5,15-methyltransferase / cobalt-precorrin-6B C5,C15-methyltransferase